MKLNYFCFFLVTIFVLRLERHAHGLLYSVSRPHVQILHNTYGSGQD